MTTTANFLGIPIDGDITRPRAGKTQRPREEFEPLVKALLDDPFIVEFGWRQYTPYFNDGDPCVFSASGAWVRTANEPKQDAGQDDEDDYDEDDTESLEISYGTHPTLGGQEGYGDNARYVGTRESQWRTSRALADAVEDGEFDHVLLDLFGDHATVKVSRTGITVDSYEHD